VFNTWFLQAAVVAGPDWAAVVVLVGFLNQP
jgi:hypothetical protein